LVAFGNAKYERENNNMTSNFADVGEFHRKFDLPSVNKSGPEPTDALKNKDLMKFRMGFLHEEMTEIEKGIEEKDIAQVADGLVDLVYVAMGTAHLLGLPWQELWDEVQRANMTKERAAEDGSNSKRGSSFDVVKPEGWQGPDIEGVLASFGHGS
jgi:predicted HAD superfamily Cof-like phosphohydrolase